jgi:hypothetical protein
MASLAKAVGDEARTTSSIRPASALINVEIASVAHRAEIQRYPLPQV